MHFLYLYNANLRGFKVPKSVLIIPRKRIHRNVPTTKIWWFLPNPLGFPKKSWSPSWSLTLENTRDTTWWKTADMIQGYPYKVRVPYQSKIHSEKGQQISWRSIVFISTKPKKKVTKPTKWSDLLDISPQWSTKRNTWCPPFLVTIVANEREL